MRNMKPRLYLFHTLFWEGVVLLLGEATTPCGMATPNNLPFTFVLFDPPLIMYVTITLKYIF